MRVLSFIWILKRRAVQVFTDGPLDYVPGNGYEIMVFA
jgi:hypothetical protein